MERQTLSAPNTVIIYRRGNVVTLQFDLTYHRLWAWHLSVSCFIIGRLQEKLNLCWISWKLFQDPSLAKFQKVTTFPKKYPPKNVEKLNTVHRPVSNHNTESWLQRIIMITNISQHSPSQYWELFYKLRPSSTFVQLSASRVYHKMWSAINFIVQYAALFSLFVS